MTVLECRAAVDWAEADQWSIETVGIDPPRPGEVLVRMLAAGLCQTDRALVTSALGAGALGQATTLVAKRGRLVIVNAHPGEEPAVQLSSRDLQEGEKQIRSCMAGSWHAQQGAPFLLDLAARGRYDPAAIVSRTYRLDDIAQGYAEQSGGEVVRAVLDLAG
jgi:alcohol dehydrogenase (nicotinoprotein)